MQKIKEIEEYSRKEDQIVVPIQYKPLPTLNHTIDPIYNCEAFLCSLGLKNINDDKSKIRLLKSADSDFIRMLAFLDCQSSFRSVNVGVLYVGEGQFTETEILHNKKGSESYEEFISLL
jgi:hypothetical protein